jgi:hypothetical protein
MTITELYEQLADPEFKDPATGDLFFPAYMYTYDPELEREIDAEIQNIKERLHRPNTYVDVLVLDIFDELCAYLETQSLMGKSKLDLYLERESKRPDVVAKDVKEMAYSEEFLGVMGDRIQAHLATAGEYEKAYVFMKGFSRIYPYLRVSRFMNKFEKHIKGYKLILFYPGSAGRAYHMFNLLQDDHLYRAIHLINEPA